MSAIGNQTTDGSEASAGCTFVIGGTGGIGRAIVQRLAAAGEPVFFTFHSRENEAREVAAQLQAGGSSRVAFGRCDLTDRAAISSCLESAQNAFGSVRSVIFSSGPNIAQEFVSELTPEQMKQVIDADVHGFFNLVQLTLPLLRRQPGASIVAVTTNAVRAYPPKDGLSSIPKSAVEATCRAIAKEEGRFGIRVNCVAPGYVEAGIGKQFMEQLYTPAVWEGQKQRVALRRFAQASEIAEVVVFVASPRASYLTGQIIAVDGGYSL